MLLGNHIAEKPSADKLTAKTSSEAAGIELRAPHLPESLRDKVCQNLCIVSMAKASEKAGSIFLADQSKEAVEYAGQVCRLEATGPFFYNKKRFGDAQPPLIGSWMLISPYVGRRWMIDDELFMIVQDTDILVRELDTSRKYNTYT